MTKAEKRRTSRGSRRRTARSAQKVKVHKSEAQEAGQQRKGDGGPTTGPARRQGRSSTTSGRTSSSRDRRGRRARRAARRRGEGAKASAAEGHPKGASHHAKGGGRGGGKSEQRATRDHVLDDRTLKILFKWVQQGHLQGIEGCIRTGKEANCYYARGGTRELRLKGWGGNAKKEIEYDEDEDVDDIDGDSPARARTLRLGARRRPVGRDPARGRGRQDLQDDDGGVQEPRRVRGGRPPVPQRELLRPELVLQACRLWAEKEYKNLLRIWRSGIPCPRPLRLQDHVMSMELVGRRGVAASAAGGRPECKTRRQALRAGRGPDAHPKDCGMVHGDLSEYNLLYYKSRAWMITSARRSR